MTTLAILVGVKIGLELARFERVRGAVMWLGQRRFSSKQPRAITPAQILWALNIASHQVPGGHNCLARALTAKLLLLRHGYSSCLHIGVTRSMAGVFEAHAWLESQGRVLVGELKELSRYKPLPAIDREA